MSKKSKSEVIVFGGSGFLGSQIVNELIKNDNKVKQVMLPVRDGMTLVMRYDN